MNNPIEAYESALTQIRKSLGLSEFDDHELVMDTIARLKKCRSALKELMENIDMLDDVSVCRDMPLHEAESCWEGATDCAYKALKASEPPPKMTMADGMAALAAYMVGK